MKVQLDMSKTDKKLLVIFDMDGTLVDVTKIRHFVEGKKKNFDIFHNESINCPPIEKVLILNKNLKKIADIYIVIFTGREEKYRDLSEKWLTINNVYYDRLLMRQNNDFRSNVVIKKELYETFSSKFSPYLAIDDTPDLRKLWIEVGFLKVYDPENFTHNY